MYARDGGDIVILNLLRRTRYCTFSLYSFEVAFLALESWAYAKVVPAFLKALELQQAVRAEVVVEVQA